MKTSPRGITTSVCPGLKLRKHGMENSQKIFREVFLENTRFKFTAFKKETISNTFREKRIFSPSKM